MDSAGDSAVGDGAAGTDMSLPFESDAKAAAAKHVANMLKRPDQLEKVEHYKRNVTRKKASVEAMLKSAVQSQLDGVRTGLRQLQNSLTEIDDIRSSLADIDLDYQTVLDLDATLKPVREQNNKHCQYAAAVENLKNIFNVPESVQRTQTLIDDDNYLSAHKCLSELENSRDDLLFEFHKLSVQNPADQMLLNKYFASVEKLSESLCKKLMLVVSRARNTAQKEPAVLVSALRIVEREEKKDEYFTLRQKQSGFLPPGRPKKWREKCFEVLRKAVDERIEGNQLEQKSDGSKMWLVRHLEIIRQIILEDLRIVKNLCQPCFPPTYDILNKSLTMYHESTKQRIEELINLDLDGNEVVSLVSWVTKDYGGSMCLAHPDLSLTVSHLTPLLDDDTRTELLDKYLSTVRSNVKEWLPKTLATDKLDWYKQELPEMDQDGHYQTALPVIIFQMIEQNLQVAQTISIELTLKVCHLCFEEMQAFSKLYKDSLIEYRNKHAENRIEPKYFVQFMVALVNNCNSLMEFTSQVMTRYIAVLHSAPGTTPAPAPGTTPAPGTSTPPNLAPEVNKMGKELKRSFHDTAIHGCNTLLEEIFTDLNMFIEELVTRKWLTSSQSTDTISATIEDYCLDLKHLRQKYFDSLIAEAELRIITEYIKAIMQKKLTFKSYNERREASDKICREAQLMRSKMEQLAGPQLRYRHQVAGSDQGGNPWEVLPLIAEIIKLQDPALLGFEITQLANKYTDIKVEHLVCVILLRGDLGRGEARQLVTDTIEERPAASNTMNTVFSRLQIG